MNQPRSPASEPAQRARRQLAIRAIGPVRHHVFCSGPTSLEAAAAAWRRSANHHRLQRRICDRGTKSWSGGRKQARTHRGSQPVWSSRRRSGLLASRRSATGAPVICSRCSAPLRQTRDRLFPPPLPSAPEQTVTWSPGVPDAEASPARWIKVLLSLVQGPRETARGPQRLPDHDYRGPHAISQRSAAAMAEQSAAPVDNPT